MLTLRGTVLTGLAGRPIPPDPRVGPSFPQPLPESARLCAGCGHYHSTLARYCATPVPSNRIGGEKCPCRDFVPVTMAEQIERGWP